MFFFFFDDMGELNQKRIIQYAFERVFYSKLRMEGYCDINPLIGKPRIAKAEIEGNLKKLQSPLAKLYSVSYPKNISMLKDNILPVIQELEHDAYYKNIDENEMEIDDYICFAIVYYILQIYSSADEKYNAIREIYKNQTEQAHSCDIRFCNGIVYDANRVEINFISSINGFTRFMENIRNNHLKLFFRGHGRIDYELQPSLFRNKKWLNNERKMYLELLSNCPFEFEGLNTHIEKLAEMQHYGLPTRLLDITQNPLVALFFACASEMAYRGEVVIIGTERDEIKYSQSDTVALLSSLPLFTLDEQKQYYAGSIKASVAMGDTFPKIIERLVQEVRLERPGFISAIKPEDLRDIVVCIPAKKNRRLENQEGAFIVCGLVDEIYGIKLADTVNTVSRLRLKNKDGKDIICIVENKAHIIKQLDDIGINKAKIYPEIDDVADYIKTHIEQI